MPVTVRIPTPLRSMTGQKAELSANGATVREVIADLRATWPELASKLTDGEGRLRRYVTFFVNDQDIRDLKEAETPVRDGDTLTIMPAIAGGCPPGRGEKKSAGRPTGSGERRRESGGTPRGSEADSCRVAAPLSRRSP